MSTNLFEVPGWNLKKVIPQKTSSNDKCNKKRKTQEQISLVERNKKPKLNNKVNQQGKINDKKDKNSYKNNDSKKDEQRKRLIKSKKLIKNVENPFADADDFDSSEEMTLKTEKSICDKPKGTLEKTKKKLSEGKFRWINERLYTTTGSKALEMFRGNPQLFDEYHGGFRSVVESWPVNPVDLLLSYLKQQSKEVIVADLGCGEGKIGLEAPNKVLSFDLVAKHDKVIVCDIAKLPIPDSFFDIVIFCLSLMGTNYVEFLKEAFRVLKPNGELKIVEVISRFSDINVFIEALAEIGFKLVNKDDTNKMFIMFDFVKKKPRKTKKSLLHNDTDLLKPCIYKKR